MKHILILAILFVTAINCKNIYEKYIDTTWIVKQQDLNTCKSTCGTCCITSLEINENGAESAGMKFYFDASTISRCKAVSTGPFSMSFNTLNTNPLTADGFSSVGTAAHLELYPSGITLKYNDSSKLSCYSGATLVGTLNPSNSGSVYPIYFLVIVLLLLSCSLF